MSRPGFNPQLCPLRCNRLILRHPLFLRGQRVLAPKFSGFSQPRTYSINNTIKKLHALVSEEKEKRQRCPEIRPPESDWHLPLETRAGCDEEKSYPSLLRTYSEPQIVLLLVLHASSLQITAPAPSHSACSYNFSVVLKTSNPTLGGLGSDVNVIT
jgi:hypothetical protein